MARWQLAIVGVAILLVALLVSGFLLFEPGSGGSTSTTSATPSGANSYGHARLVGSAPKITPGNPYQRKLVIRATNRTSGVPLHGAKVLVHGEMTVPHVMSLYTERLRETGRGTYKGPYTLIMPGTWKIVVVATSKTGDTSTGSFPVHVTG